MHTFQINALIHFLMSSMCFEHHVFIIRKTLCTSVFIGMFFIHLCKQSSRWKDVLDTDIVSYDIVMLINVIVINWPRSG
jgi:hypothetical protein